MICIGNIFFRSGRKTTESCFRQSMHPPGSTISGFSENTDPFFIKWAILYHTAPRRRYDGCDVSPPNDATPCIRAFVCMREIPAKSWDVPGSAFYTIGRQAAACIRVSCRKNGDTESHRHLSARIRWTGRSPPSLVRYRIDEEPVFCMGVRILVGFRDDYQQKIIEIPSQCVHNLSVGFRNGNYLSRAWRYFSSMRFLSQRSARLCFFFVGGRILPFPHCGAIALASTS